MCTSPFENSVCGSISECALNTFVNLKVLLRDPHRQPEAGYIQDRCGGVFREPLNL